MCASVRMDDTLRSVYVHVCFCVCASFCSGEARVYSLENKNEGGCLFGKGMNFYCIFSESPQAIQSLGPKISSPGLSESTRCSNPPSSVICFNSSSSLYLCPHHPYRKGPLVCVTLKKKSPKRTAL